MDEIAENNKKIDENSSKSCWWKSEFVFTM